MTATVRQKVPPSYCCVCDERDPCEHVGPRYHDPWFDLRIDGKLDPKYQAWFDENPWGQEERSAPKARPISSLEGELEKWLYLDPELRSRLREAYEENDRRTSLMVQDILRACEGGRLMRPAATLASRLKHKR